MPSSRLGSEPCNLHEWMAAATIRRMKTSPGHFGFQRAGIKGMTLLELMTVIVIIGILAVMLLPIYSSITASADEARCVANLWC